MATVPAPRTWVVGEVVTAAKMNELRDALNFMLSPPLFILGHSVAQATPNSANYNLLFDTEVVDRDNGHSTVTNTSRYVSQTAGYYALSANVPWVTNGTGVRQVFFLINGTTLAGWVSLQAGASGSMGLSLSRRIYLAVADFVEVQTFQSSGAALNTQTANGGISFEGQWSSK
ncbi:hypothetical protein DQ384_38245 [Sphaerisporangium album]|uniref:C1q domain-containing protein n=1 Tax=Sphaerisporangium album TaxID=509200 RepID=A0A367EMC5_9ACTN|nr:hypothetical protein [Sphaerisporangium album]RCG19123.1 hypothetical protein DQ384_38245 [Sphaerisporangium album]